MFSNSLKIHEPKKKENQKSGRCLENGERNHINCDKFHVDFLEKYGMV